MQVYGRYLQPVPCHGVSTRVHWSFFITTYSALIAAGVDGVKDGLVLPAPINQDPATVDSANDITDLPRSLHDALDTLAGNAMLMQALGEPLAKAFLAVKRAEVKHYSGLSFESEVESLERRF